MDAVGRVFTAVTKTACAGPIIFGAGTHTFKCHIRDNAGNPSTVTTSFTVV